MVIDGGGRGGLEDEDVFISDGRVDLNAGLKREELGDMAGCKGDTETVGGMSARSHVQEEKQRSKGSSASGAQTCVTSSKILCAVGIKMRERRVPCVHSIQDSPSSDGFCKLGVTVACGMNPSGQCLIKLSTQFRASSS
jgi:hypothetical protein